MAALDTAAITNPKRKPRDGSAWYSYYAGYSADFVGDVLGLLAPPKEAPLKILDPWNGSGTTTAVAAAKGHETVGIDRSPALVTIAKGRHLAIASVEESLDPLTAEIFAVAKGMIRKIRAGGSADDELTQWFTPTSAARFRAVERGIYRVLVDEAAPEIPSEPVDPESLSSLAAFFYCGLFTVTRQLTSAFRTTNPTWIRGAKHADELVDVPWSVIEAQFSEACSALSGRLTIPSTKAPAHCHLYEGSAEQVELEAQADVTLTSPPYCTRIDYVVATKPELAVMAHDASDIKRLRRQMLGTPITKGVDPSISEAWGEKASTFLSDVHSHSSKASKTYYYRYYIAYLRGLFSSMAAIDRATKPDGAIGLVVQDSFFKDVHFDLPGILTEMGESLSRRSERADFPVSRTKAAIHPVSREYRSTFDAMESLIVFREKGD